MRKNTRQSRFTDEQKDYMDKHGHKHTCRQLADMFGVEPKNVNGYLNYHKITPLPSEKFVKNNWDWVWETTKINKNF